MRLGKEFMIAGGDVGRVGVLDREGIRTGGKDRRKRGSEGSVKNSRAAKEY